ncbi:MAG: hypothetical protein JJ975_07860 [Bacteroidia bacterium]|nr:hypothetical protein [Bacteroidia bacterium]
MNIKTLLLGLFLFSAFGLKAFTEYPVIGTYGVSNNDASSIELVLNSDSTFTYQDFSDPQNRVEVKGTWTEKGGKVKLHGDMASNQFHSVWKIKQNGSVATSRKGLNFYRICRKES